MAYRHDYTLEDFSAAYRTNELARYFADIFTERNHYADVPSIIRQFEAIIKAPSDHYGRVACPMIILNGSEDAANATGLALKERIPNCEMTVIQGAGHASHMEQPWVFDRLMIDFLKRHGLHPE